MTPEANEASGCVGDDSMISHIEAQQKRQRCRKKGCRKRLPVAA
jgi:hypothetical protein